MRPKPFALFALFALICPLAATADTAAVQVEIRNVTHDTAFSEILAWTHPYLTGDLHASGPPPQALVDVSRSLPAAPLAELVRSLPRTGALVRDTATLRPGERTVVEIPTGVHSGYTVLMPFAGSQGYAYFTGYAPSSGTLAERVFGWEAAGHVWIHREHPGPVALLRVRLTYEEAPPPPPQPDPCPSWGGEAHC